MSGRGHRVHSGICLIRRAWQRCDQPGADAALGGEDIEAYLATGEWQAPAAMPFKSGRRLYQSNYGFTAILSVCPCLRRPICYKLLASGRAKDYFPQKSEI